VSVFDIVLYMFELEGRFGIGSAIAQMSMSRSGNESVFDHVQNNVKHTLG
jgi:hypothetical protein